MKVSSRWTNESRTRPNVTPHRGERQGRHDHGSLSVPPFIFFTPSQTESRQNRANKSAQLPQVLPKPADCVRVRFFLCLLVGPSLFLSYSFCEPRLLITPAHFAPRPKSYKRHSTVRRVPVGLSSAHPSYLGHKSAQQQAV